MANPLPRIAMPTAEQFAEEYISKQQPVVITGLDYDAEQWKPKALDERIGNLTALVYGSLFELDDVQTLSDYLETWFNQDGEMEPDTPYVRWYNQLRDVEFSWGDEAFERVASAWRAPTALSATDFVVPASAAGAGTNPVTDAFPYRGLLVAAKGARTRMHRDPFCSDAVVCQFYGRKEAALYSPDRIAELTKVKADNSFGGFIDVREDNLEELSVDPDFHGIVEPGEMIYIPNSWLHDVLAIDDSVSITWNFVHRRGASNFREYLKAGWQQDSEFEILQYFQRSIGNEALTAEQIGDYHFAAELA